MKQAYSNNWFRLSAGAIFAITGSAKIVSAFGSAKILTIVDPVLDLRFGHVMVVIGILELAIASLCLINRFQSLSIILIAWFATDLLAYRFGLWWMGWHMPCHCLGNLTDAIHVSSQAADNVMKVVAAYLLIGSYATLFWLWKEKRKASLVSHSSEKATGSAS